MRCSSTCNYPATTSSDNTEHASSGNVPSHRGNYAYLRSRHADAYSAGVRSITTCFITRPSTHQPRTGLSAAAQTKRRVFCSAPNPLAARYAFLNLLTNVLPKHAKAHLSSGAPSPPLPLFSPDLHLMSHLVGDFSMMPG
jgi:hypothetical protein